MTFGKILLNNSNLYQPPRGQSLWGVARSVGVFTPKGLQIIPWLYADCRIDATYGVFLLERPYHHENKYCQKYTIDMNFLQ